MRIMLFAAGGDIGGGKTHILSIAEELSRSCDLRLVSFRKGVLSTEAMQMGLDTADIDGTRSFAATVRFALQQVDGFKPDIIHCHGAKANLIGVIVKQLRHVPVMTTVHSDPRLDYLGAPLKQYTYGFVNALALRRMDYYVAVAGRMKEILIERGFDPCRIFTVYNGLNFSGASDSPKPAKDPEDTIVVGIAARLNPVKDIPTVLRAFAKAYSQDKRLRLSIAGTGEDENALRRLANQLGISEVTVFEGWISDISAYFKRIDINVLSSLSETFPYSLLEGAYEHCPAIASNVGGIPYLIKNGETGYLYEPGDVDSFSKYILRLAADSELRTMLAENLFRKARDEFSLQRMRGDQEEIYRTVLRRRQRGDLGGAVLCGAYGKGNAGDEAILKAILSQLREIDRDMPYWVMSRNPGQTSAKEGVRSYYIFNVPAFLSSLRRAELFVNGGGSLIQDVTSSRSLYFYLFTLWAAKRCGCRVIMYGCGIGPLLKDRDRRLAGSVLNSCADIITLRDSVSLELLDQIGVTRPEIILAADPTVNLPGISRMAVDAALEQEGIPAGLPMIGFCLREWPGFDNYEGIRQAAEYVYGKYGLTPVFLPIEYPKDIEIGRRMAEGLSVPSYVCTGSRSVEDTIGMLGSMKLVCGMRLHSLIFATAGNTPVVGISYDVKVDSFIKDIGSDACVSAVDFSAAELIEKIDEVLAGGTDIGMETGCRLRENERKNGQAAARLLSEKRQRR